MFSCKRSVHGTLPKKDCSLSMKGFAFLYFSFNFGVSSGLWPWSPTPFSVRCGSGQNNHSRLLKLIKTLFRCLVWCFFPHSLHQPSQTCLTEFFQHPGSILTMLWLWHLLITLNIHTTSAIPTRPSQRTTVTNKCYP